MNPEASARRSLRKRAARDRPAKGRPVQAGSAWARSIPDRSAHASLRGYLYQVCLGVKRWLAMADGEILVCEGDEDLDRRILGGRVVFDQIKVRSRPLGLGDAAVVEGLRHFLRAYVDLQRQGRAGRYVFTTTAKPRRRSDGLDFDLLQKWRDGDRSKRTCNEVRKLMAGKGAPEWVAEPAAWLDGEEGWKGYLDAVDWTFGAPDLQAVRREIAEQIGSHPRLRLLPPEDVLERLVGEVLRRSSEKDQADRVLTRTDLDRLADDARSDLAEWAKTAGAPLRRLFEEIEKLDGLLTDHTRELRENPTPGQLLTASYEVIPFHEAGRDKELSLLADWCNSDERRDVLLLTGEGGAGKTRLAIEWCRRLRHQGWHAGFLQWECDPAGLPALLAGAAPRLVVIDYAETRLSVLKPLLYKMAVNRGTGPKVRLLLLSRREGDWWEALRRGDERAEVGDLLARVEARPIAPLVPGEEERRSAFRAAAEGFALVQGRKLPRHLPEPPFEKPAFERVLYLHMAALAALDGKTIGSAAEALAETLKHEQRFWKEQVKEMGLDTSLARWMDKALSRAVAGLTLLGGADEERARGLLGRVLDPPAGRADLVEQLLETLHRLYRRKQDQGPDLEPLRPDLLGEELIGAELERDPELLDRVLDGATAGHARSALTALTCLAQRRPRQGRSWLAAAFQGERLERFAELALKVAIEIGDPVGMVLAGEVEERASGELARRLMDQCLEDSYFRSVRLWEVGLASTQRCYALLAESGRPDDNGALAERVQLALRLGILLSELGRRDEALLATEEAVRNSRLLARWRPDIFLSKLAGSLCNLGLLLSDLGRHEDALSATKEAVEHYRLLSMKGTNTVLPDLAMSLNNLGKILGDLSRGEEALEATEEAIGYYRSLALNQPKVFLPALTISLNNMGKRLSDLGRREKALAVTAESVELLRSLALARPDAFMSDLAKSLNNLGILLSASGRHEEALAATEETVALWRSLASTRPNAFLPYLAGGLNNFGNRLDVLGRHKEAVLATEEAVRTLAPFFSLYPAAFRERMRGFIRNYLRRSEATGWELDRKLLAPLLEPLGLSLDPPAPPDS